MQYPQYEPLPMDSMFPFADPNQQMPSSLSMDHSQGYTTLDGPLNGSGREPLNDHQAYYGQGMGNIEDGGDAARGPRLSQEQLAYLEGEFALHYKPSTDHKKALAERMGVEFAKVNNWFQNRRAKAKLESQAQQRSDRSAHDTGPMYAETPAGYRTFPNAQSSDYHSSPEQGPFMSDDLVPPADFESIEPPPQYYAQSSTFPTDQGYEPPVTFPPDFVNVLSVTPQAPWPVNNFYGDIKISPPVQGLVTSGMISNPHSIQSYSPEVVPVHGNWHTPNVYHNASGAEFIGNGSLQSLGTSPSDEDQPNSYITPPNEASPLPGLNKGNFQHDRQTSNSSDLAENLDTVHLQQSQISLSVGETSTSQPVSSSSSTTGLLTPDVSPDTVAPKMPSTHGHDLASRRKRPRPAALQPEPHRSISYAGQSATSPLLRLSPPDSGKLSPVRCIKSTGNNMSVMTGRVKKSSTMPAQLSPRNFETCFHSAVKPEVRSDKIAHQQSRQDRDINGSSVPGSPPGSLASNHAKGMLLEGSSQLQLPPTVWDHGSTDEVRNVQNECGWAPSHSDHTRLNIVHPPPQPQQAFYPQQYQVDCPPQSAPPHITAFNVGPSILDASGGQWLITPAPYRDDTRLSIPMRANNFQHYHHNGLFDQYQAPGPSFHPGLSQFLSYQQFCSRPPSPPQKALDIKVDLGPPPPKEMISQERKEYIFENSFPCDHLFKSGSKK